MFYLNRVTIQERHAAFYVLSALFLNPSVQFTPVHPYVNTPLMKWHLLIKFNLLIMSLMLPSCAG